MIVEVLPKRSKVLKSAKSEPMQPRFANYVPFLVGYEEGEWLIRVSKSIIYDHES